MTPEQVLVGAKALIADPAKWTKGALARRADGSEGSPALRSYYPGGPVMVDETLTCFCTFGAILRVAGDALATDSPSTIALGIFMRVNQRYENEPIGKFNDDPSTTHADIMLAFDKAIDYARTNRK